MDYARLKTLLAEHTDERATAEEAAAALNALTVTRVLPEMLVTERTLYGRLGPEMGEEILQRLDAAAESESPMAPVIARTRGWLRPGEGGIDLAHPATRVQVQALGDGGVLTAEQAAALLAMAEETVSPAQAAGLGVVRLGDVLTARALL